MSIAIPRAVDSSAAMRTGSLDKMQRKEAVLGRRDHVPMKSDKPHVQPAGEVPLVAGDSSHVEG